jgi:hypothetical protein
MFNPTFLAAVAALLFSNVAHASTVTIEDILGVNPSANPTFSTGGALSPNISVNQAKFRGSGNYGPVPGHQSYSGLFAAPTGSYFGHEYLYVAKDATATFNFKSSDINTFGLTWGTIDGYNKLTVVTTNGKYVITGTELLNYLAGSTPGTTQADLIISAPIGRILKVKLSSSSNSFEAANFMGSYVAPVPLPASSVLFGMALAALAFVGFRRKNGTI